MIIFLLSGLVATTLSTAQITPVNPTATEVSIVMYDSTFDVASTTMEYSANDRVKKTNLIQEQEQSEKVTIAQEMKIIASENEKREQSRIASVGFSSKNLLVKSNITVDELRHVLNNVTKGSGLAPYASYFVECEKEYGVNALILCSIAALESGWGRHKGGSGTNITGYAVYSSKHNGKTFKGGIHENLLATAQLLKESYLTEGGRCYNGLSLHNVNKRYCLNENGTSPDYNWSVSIESIANKLSTKYDDLYRQP